MVDPSPVDSPFEAYPGYRLEAKGREAAEDERLKLLEQVFDPGSRQRRELVRPGWRCLEVGAGRGSMAAWLAERVGPDGQVVAIDIDVGYLARLDVPNLVVRRHDILNDPIDDLDPGSFDLVCSRLMLFWLAGRQERAVQHMVQCLRPGGWLIDEDGDWGAAGPVDPLHPLYAGYHRVYQGGGWFAARGYDPFFGRKLAALFDRCGLQNIRHQVTANVVRGASPWARWWADTLDAIRGWGMADETLPGSAEQEHQALIGACLDPSVWLMSELLHACRGQLPADEARSAKAAR
jgi:SAM-dependent methyltransferase